MLTDLTTGIQHVGIPTNDLEETVRFYTGLGFQLIRRENNDGELVAFLQLHSLVIETYQNGRAAMCDGAIDHIAIDVTDIQAAYDTIARAGYDIAEGMQFLPFWENGVRFFKLRGPNGEVLELCQRLE